MRKVLAGIATTVVAVLVVQVLGAGAVATPPAVTPTNMTINGRVSSLALANGRLFVGGLMTVPFVRLGALDPSSGSVVWSAPGITSEVRALAAVGDVLVAGGDFGLRAYSTSSFALLTTIPCGSVRALEPDLAGGSVFVGGRFTSCAGQTHKNVARLDLATLAVSSTWTPRADGTVLSLVADAGGVFVGGSFGSLNGTPRYRLGKLTDSGGLDAWSSAYVPNSGDVGSAKSVRALDVAAGRLFASWGESVNKTVVYDQATAVYVRHWGSDGDTQALLGDGGNIYLGGHWYQFVGPGPAVYFAAFDASTLANEPVVTPTPNSPMGIFAIISDGAGGLWLGGDVVGALGTPAISVKRLVHLTPGSSPGTTTTTSSTTTSSTTSTTTTSTTSTTSTSTSTTVPATDTQEPDSRVSAPVPNSTVASPYTFAGTATDDVAVTRVRIAVRNAATQLWLQANGTFASTFAQFDATLSAPGTSSTGWTWVRSLPAGSYYVQSKATDASGRNETVTPWVAFTIA